MLDRESTFAQPEIVKLLKTSFVPVAIDQAYQRRQQDTEGEFYRKIAGQGPRSNFNGTTQGFYIATASGKLLLYNNNRDPEKVLRLMQEKLAAFQASREASAETAEIQATKVDVQFQPKPPPGGLIVRVRAKVLDGYEPTTDPWQRIFQTSLSRDNLWISKAEHDAIVRGTIPRSLQQRIAKYHLVDNTRGEPPNWHDKELRQVDLKISAGKISGFAHLETAKGDRGYKAHIVGEVETKNGRVTRLDFVAKGDFWGEGPFTKNAPQGQFPLAVSFTIADGTDIADQIPPQASRGWVRGYISE